MVGMQIRIFVGLQHGREIKNGHHITVTKHDALHGADASYAGTITLATSTAHGDWSLVTGSGVLTNAGNGAATYAFAASDNGQVVLGLRNTFAEMS